MRRLLLFALLLCPVFVFAHQPVLPDFPTYQDIFVIEDTTFSQAFYAELTGFAHRYQFRLTEEQSVAIDILVPDIETATNNINGLLVREVRSGRIEAVARLDSSDASWESFYEPFGGDSYRQGPTYSEVLPAGTYIFEVSNGDNAGKYVISIGKKERFGEMDLFTLIGRMYTVKQFFGKPPIAVVQSPFYAVPLVLVLVLGWFIRRRLKKSYAA